MRRMALTNRVDGKMLATIIDHYNPRVSSGSLLIPESLPCTLSPGTEYTRWEECSLLVGKKTRRSSLLSCLSPAVGIVGAYTIIYVISCH